jgi:polyisoprenoid-binding protein YceI
VGILALNIFCNFPQSAAEQTAPIVKQAIINSQSRLWLVGDSTLHAWTATTTELAVKMGIQNPNGTIYEDIQANKMKSLETVVPIKSLKSGKNQMDKNMYKALKSAEHPNITFQLTNYDVLASTVSTTFPILARGELSIAGQIKTVEIQAVVSQGNQTRIQGTKEILMTDFGVKPPTIMGAIKTHNRVLVNFDLYFD